MALFLRLAALVAFVPFIVAAPAASDCTGTIASLDDVAAAVKCTTVNINSFTVPAGKTFDIKLLDGTTVNMRAFTRPVMQSAQTLTVPRDIRGRREVRCQELGRSALPDQVRL